MANKLWCIATSHPLVRQIADKYNLTKNQARTILNNAKRDNPALQGDDYDLDFLESQDSFNEALDVFTRERLSASSIFDEPVGTQKVDSDFLQDIRNELGLTMSEERANRLLGQMNGFARIQKNNKVSAKNIADVLSAFSDTRHLEFLGDWICRNISYMLTQLQSDASYREDLGVGKLQFRRDYLKDTTSWDAIREGILDDLEENIGYLNDKPELQKELKAVIDNFDTVLYMYGSRLFRMEGIRIGMLGAKSIEAIDATEDERNEVEEDNMEEDDENADENERPVNEFSASDQNKSVLSKMVPDIKTLLYNLINTDSHGYDVLDPYGFGLWTFVDVHQAVNDLLSIMQGTETVQEMMDALERNVSAKPWLEQLILTLDYTEDNGQENNTSEVRPDDTRSQKEQLQTMFYRSIMSKQFTQFRQGYLKRIKGAGLTVKNSDGNVDHRSEQLLNLLRSRFRRGAGAYIFSAASVDFGRVRNLRKEIIALQNSMRKEPAATVTEATASEYLDKINELLKQFGIRSSKNLLAGYSRNGAAAANEPVGTTMYHKAENILTRLRSMTDDFAKWDQEIQEAWKKAKNEKDAKRAAQLEADAQNLELTSPFDYSPSSFARSIGKKYTRLINTLCEYSPDSFESSAYMAGKRRYSYNNPSTVQTIVQRIAQDKDFKKRQRYILDKYGRDKLWFMKASSTTGSPQFYSDILQALYDGELDMNAILRYSEKPIFQGKEYDKQTGVDYEMNILTDFFAPVSGYEGGNVAWYRMPISSDKPRFATLRMPRYQDESDTENNYKRVIQRKAQDFLVQEMRRAIDTVEYDAFQDGVRVKNYDVNTKDPAIHRVLDKMNAGQKVTASDVAPEGKYLFRNSGAAFFFNPFIMSEIEAKTDLGEFIVDRVFNSHMLGERDALPENMIPVFNDAFDEYMETLQYNYYDKLQKQGLFVEQLSTDTNGSRYHLKYLQGTLQDWHRYDKTDYGQKLASYNQAATEFLGVNDPTKSDKERAEAALHIPAMREKMLFYDDLQNYVYNNYLAKVNMLQIFDVDPAFYGGTQNFQKRNAQIVSAGFIPDPGAMLHGDTVSDGKYRSITIKIDKAKTISSHYRNLEFALEREINKIADPARRDAALAEMHRTIDGLQEFDPTDGQAFIGLTGLRKKMVGLGGWSRSSTKEMDTKGYVMQNGKRSYIYTDEAVYQRMLRGETQPEDWLHIFVPAPLKGFTYSFSDLQRGGRNATVPVQHKNSEYALIFLSAFQRANPQSIDEALSMFLEQTAKKKPKQGIDTINFDSGVKIGENTAVIDITGLSPAEALKKLNEAIYNENDNYRTGVVTEFDQRDYKIVQEKNEHFRKDATQPTGSQVKVLAINNITKDAKINFRGKEITGRQLVKRYFDRLTEKTKNSVAAFAQEVGLDLPYARRQQKLSAMLKESMATDQKFSVDMRQALSLTDINGVDEFVVPLDEVGTQSAVEALMYSKIRGVFYKQRTRGGIVVQATSYGAKDDLHIRFSSKNPRDKGGVVKTFDEFQKANPNSKDIEADYKKYLEESQGDFAYFEMEAPMPDHIKRMLRDASGNIDRRFFNNDGTWNMKAIKEVVPARYFDTISYRVPTEAKYSIMIGRIVQFSPEWGGSVVRYPKELTFFTGSDFDIDTDFVELRPVEGDPDYEIDNELFDLRLAALRSSNGIIEAFRSGDFSDLQELSYKVAALQNGYKPEDLEGLSFKQLQDICKDIENYDLIDPSTDGLLHLQNSDAKSMIGIAAVGVTSHAFISLYNEAESPQEATQPTMNTRIKISEKAQFTVVNEDGSQYTVGGMDGTAPLDTVYDMDGVLIGTQVSKYVGGSADAAKDAALYRLNINSKTLPILVFLHRLGVSKDVARLYLSQPVIRRVIDEMNSNALDDNSTYLTSAIRSVRDAVLDERENTKNLDSAARQKLWETAGDDKSKTLNYRELMQNIIDPDSQSAYDMLVQLQMLNNFNELQRSVRNLDSFTRYNSTMAMKGASFISRMTSRKKIERLKANLAGEKPAIMLPSNIRINEEYEDSEFGRLCSMYPYIAETILGEEDMTDRLLRDTMHTYNAAFDDASDIIMGRNRSAMQAEDEVKMRQKIYEGWKTFLLFAGGNEKIADFTNPAVARYYLRDYAEIYWNKMQDYTNKYPSIMKNNSFIDSIVPEHAPDGYADFSYLTVNHTGMSEEAQEQYKRDWERLLQNEDTKKLAIDTTIHFLAQAAAFNRNTPVTLMPLAIKQALPHYLDAFRDADKTPMPDYLLNAFTTLFFLNNSNDRRFVPAITNTDKRLRYIYDTNDPYTLRINKRYSAAIAPWLIHTEGSTQLELPVLKVGETLLGVTDTEVQEEKRGKEDYYVLQVIPVQGKGIPGHMAEYTMGDYNTSILQDGSYTAAPEQNDTNQLDENDSEDTTYFDFINDEDEYLEEGVRSGQFLESYPFGADNVDSDVADALAKDSLDRASRYTESRTHIRRMEAIVPALGFKISSAQRSVNTDGQAEYLLNIVPVKGRKTQEDALRVAALASTLGFVTSMPSVKTYCYEEDANAVELSIPVTTNNEKAVLDRAVQQGLEASFNADRKELEITIGIEDIANGSTLLDKAKALLETLQNDDLTDTDTIEFNYVQYERLGQRDVNNILTEIREDYGKESDERVTEIVEERQDIPQRREVGLADLADLALRRLSGEDVTEELIDTFRESKTVMLSTRVSYTSQTLADTVINDLADEDVYNDLFRILDSEQSAPASTAQAIDNLIINTANWILGNRPESLLLERFQQEGLSEDQGRTIMQKVKDVLKEKDIC